MLNKKGQPRFALIDSRTTSSGQMDTLRAGTPGFAMLSAMIDKAALAMASGQVLMLDSGTGSDLHIGASEAPTTLMSSGIFMPRMWISE